jgi:sensor domain CHASE-containing protein
MSSQAAPVAKYILKIKEEAGLKEVGKVVEREGANGSVYMTVEGTDLIVGTNKDGHLVLKKKNADPDAEYAYSTITRLFENESKSGNAYHRGKTQEGVVYMMFPNTPKTKGRSGGRNFQSSGAAKQTGAKPAGNGFQRRQA